MSPLSVFQAPCKVTGHRGHLHLTGRLLVSSAFISFQTTFTVPLVPEPWLCQAAPVHDSPSQGPLPPPSNPGRDQTLCGGGVGVVQELSLEEWSQQGLRIPPPLSCYVWRQESLPLPHLSPEVAVCCLAPAPLTQHTRQQLFLETIILLSRRNFITYLQSSSPTPKIQSNKLTFSI